MLGRKFNRRIYQFPTRRCGRNPPHAISADRLDRPRVVELTQRQSESALCWSALVIILDRPPIIESLPTGWVNAGSPGVVERGECLALAALLR